MRENPRQRSVLQRVGDPMFAAERQGVLERDGKLCTHQFQILAVAVVDRQRRTQADDDPALRTPCALRQRGNVRFVHALAQRPARIGFARAGRSQLDERRAALAGNRKRDRFEVTRIGFIEPGAAQQIRQRRCGAVRPLGVIGKDEREHDVAGVLGQCVGGNRADLGYRAHPRNPRC